MEMLEFILRREDAAFACWLKMPLCVISKVGTRQPECSPPELVLVFELHILSKWVFWVQVLPACVEGGQIPASRFYL